MTFDDAILRLLVNEGGYVNNPKDPGGETKYGISKRAYPTLDIKNLTHKQAADIYRRDYWNPCSCDDLPDAMRFEMLDMAVNIGVKPAIKTFQTAIGTTADGRIGPNTLKAAFAVDSLALLRKMQGQRLMYYTSLSTFATFGKGWVNRIANNMLA